ncbi:F-box DNA helicase 1 isoform X1 [Brienomyrus brachyistius]|uniref:F-box DNA helicase 1 isoform X1 n=2 Tax=Brienomyrus brachyistius TaxID=42636 RepID=UPI0020B44572|nr:F-box DNA helicase 1 isoform X1 [Brienomyrus brachyistius]XP_048879724.1 F-box DNA helicase 1 isoform X1 [Brienomyrus brachyistius]XP_048879735.1 F-box DNA helicase 1 isoform X1 [Brienomyrus brachyistius]
MESAMRGRAKRRHLNASECAELGGSMDGRLPLTQPSSVPRNQAHCSRRLHPRSPTKRGRREAVQQGIRTFFPVKGVVRVSPKKATAVVVKKEEETDWDDCIPDEVLQGLSEEELLQGFPGDAQAGEPEVAASCGSQGYPAALPRACHVKLEAEDGVEPLPDAHYGLLGSTRDWVEPHGSLGDLPEEVLRMVLVHLPAEDLYCSACLVCHRWRDVVRDPMFVPWKKMYFRYRMKERQAVEEVTAILRDNDITRKNDLCVLNMVRCTPHFLRGVRVCPEEVLRCVQQHRLFAQAEACLRHRFPGLEQVDGGPNPWAALVLMLILAESVMDVLDLAAQVDRSGCLMFPGGVSEFLWYMATLLLAMRETGIHISNRWHYNIFYVLHLMENSSSPASLGESWTVESGINPSIKSCSRGTCRTHPESRFRPTNEQQRILSHPIHAEHVVKIMAFAGTGKTSTLVQFAWQRPHLRFLYVAFNRSVAVEARRIFPKNVDCKTVHCMAFHAIGTRYQRIRKLSSNLKPFSVAWVLPKGHGGYVNAKVVTRTIAAFLASECRDIDVDHVPTEYKNTNGQKKSPSHQEKLMFASIAQDIWEKMKDLTPMKKPAYHMTHDGYLKLWQLQKPCLDEYDVIFIDEAQDCSPVILDIMMSQRCGKVLVGDPHQQIYTFRGAVNAMQTVPHTHLYYLTQSFRFGPEIAYVGATILEACKNVTKTLVGGKCEGSVRGESDPAEGLQYFNPADPRRGKVAILSRHNGTVFDGAVRLTESEPRPRLHIVGGVENFGLGTIMDLWVLMQPEEDRKRKNLAITDYFIRGFCRGSLGGYAGLKHYVLQTEDLNLEVKLIIVEKYNMRIPELVDRIRALSVDDPRHADVILGTVHKSKGLEFDTVVVTDDFVKMPCAQHNMQRLGYHLRDVPDDEWNVLYVAVTRAKRRLVLTKTIENLLTLAGEYFLRSQLTGTLLTEGQPPCCSVPECRNHIRVESALTMCKVPIRFMHYTDVGGPLCATCVEQRLGPAAFLVEDPEQVRAMPYTRERLELPVNVAMLMALF